MATCISHRSFRCLVAWVDLAQTAKDAEQESRRPNTSPGRTKVCQRTAVIAPVLAKGLDVVAAVPMKHVHIPDAKHGL